jgi:hypothetical protein
VADASGLLVQLKLAETSDSGLLVHVKEIEAVLLNDTL